MLPIILPVLIGRSFMIPFRMLLSVLSAKRRIIVLIVQLKLIISVVIIKIYAKTMLHLQLIAIFVPLIVL
jgi:hypothetical protein